MPPLPKETVTPQHNTFKIDPPFYQNSLYSKCAESCLKYMVVEIVEEEKQCLSLCVKNPYLTINSSPLIHQL